MNRQYVTIGMLGICTMLLGAPLAKAAEGDWLIRFGAHQIDPKSNNSPIVGVKAAESVSLGGSFFFTDHFAVEVFAAAPFNHVITLNADGSRVAKTKHIPPTLSLQYHFLPQSSVRPYIGAGVNYTVFFDETTRGALEGTRLELRDSFGFAAEAGLDIELNDRWALNLNLRWFDLDTKARLNGADLGTVQIDPYAYGLMLTRRLRF